MSEPSEALRIRAYQDPSEVAGDAARQGSSETPAPYGYPELQASGENEEAVATDASTPPDATLRTVLGHTSLDRAEAARLQADDIVPLDSGTSDPVEIQSGGRVIARGELLVFQGRFCVRVTELVPPETNPHPSSTDSLPDLTETSA